MSVDYDDPIPAMTVDLIDWLDLRFPATCPTTLDDPAHLESCLKRGAIRDLITLMRIETSPEE